MTTTIFVSTWRQVQPPIRRLVIAMILLMASTASAQTSGMYSYLPLTMYSSSWCWCSPVYSLQTEATAAQMRADLGRTQIMEALYQATMVRNHVLSEKPGVLTDDDDAAMKQAIALSTSGDVWDANADTLYSMGIEACFAYDILDAAEAFSLSIERHGEALAQYDYGKGCAVQAAELYQKILAENP